MRGSVFRARTSFASAPSSTSGASVSRWTPSVVVRRSPRDTLSSMRFHTVGGSSGGSEGVHRCGEARYTAAAPPNNATPAPGHRSGRRKRAASGRLLLAPGQRHELAAVLGERLRDRIRGVEHGHRTVDLDLRPALRHDAAEDPCVTIHIDVALAEDEALVAEVRVQAQVAVDVQEPL